MLLSLYERLKSIVVKTVGKLLLKNVLRIVRAVFNSGKFNDFFLNNTCEIKTFYTENLSFTCDLALLHRTSAKRELKNINVPCMSLKNTSIKTLAITLLRLCTFLHKVQLCEKIL